MAALGALQGLALWVLVETWPEEAPRLRALFVGAVFLVVGSALVVHMARTGRHRLRLAATAALAGSVLGAIACWVAWQLPAGDVPYRGDDARVSSWILASGIALYALGPFLQVYQETGRLRAPYSALYRHAWSNFFVAALGVFFALALWLLLFLWMRLFGLLGIDLFEEIFTEPLFLFPVLGAALAYGLATGRESESVIATLRGLTQSLFRALLPILAAVTAVFLAALPFTGPGPLFATRSAAAVLIAWTAAHVLLLNAVYQDGSERPPYTAPLRRLCEAGTLLLPVIAGIAVYAVLLRVRQYGLTPDRVFAGVVAVVLGLYATCYAAAVLLRGEPWLPRLRPVNVALACVVIALALLLHTPLLDPIAWSVRHQVARLRGGAVGPAEFDFGALRFELGHRGFAALAALEADPPAPADVTRERIELARRAESYREWRDQGGAGIDVAGGIERPTGAPWPAGLAAKLRGAAVRDWRIRECGKDTTCVLVDRDLDGDGRDEALLGVGSPQLFEVDVFARTAEGGWEHAATLRPAAPARGALETGRWLDALRDGRLDPAPPTVPDLVLGGDRLRVHPR